MRSRRSYDPALTDEERREIDAAMDELDAGDDRAEASPIGTLAEKFRDPIGLAPDGRSLNIVRPGAPRRTLAD